MLRYLLQVLKDKLCLRQSKESYSQLGEDLVLDPLLAELSKGVYVDVGSNHPMVYSNTYKLYLKGWQGLCVDPNASFSPLYAQHRPRDTFLNYAISNEEGALKFHLYEDDRVSHIGDGKNVPAGVQVLDVQAKKLNSILQEQGVEKDFNLLNIDVEGHEMEVLKSLDFEYYSPGIILVEIHHMDFEKLSECEIYQYLIKRNYELIALNLITAFFRKKV
ncbi:MAG: FkbM family methyltransferase [Planctomycetes bacterium]|nr:FkbM family methyltransferase [Planctomycetota bacterium]